MRRIIMFNFDLLQLHKCDDHWWVAVCNVELDDFHGALLHVERDGKWKFDILYTRWFYHKLLDWWES